MLFILAPLGHEDVGGIVLYTLTKVVPEMIVIACCSIGVRVEVGVLNDCVYYKMYSSSYASSFSIKSHNRCDLSDWVLLG